MQLKVEVQKLYAWTIMDLALCVGDTNDLFSLSDYINEWRLITWEITFFREFKSKDRIGRSKAWEQQIGGNEALKRILYE
jgi:hypothetical protein